MGLVSIDGIDLEVAGYSVTQLGEVYSAPDATWPALDVPQRAGVILIQNRPNVSARGVQFSLLVRGTNRTDAEAQVQELKGLLYGRRVSLTFDWMVSPARSYPAVLESLDVGLFAAGNVGGWLIATVQMLIPDAYAVEDALTTATAVPTAAVSVPVGTGPTYAKVTLAGAATNPTLTFRDYTGATIGTMVFLVTLGANDRLEIDAADGGSVTRYTGSTPSNGLSLITNGDYVFPVFYPDSAFITEYDRLTEDGFTRITEDDYTRITEAPFYGSVTASTGTLLTVASRRTYL
jgi:hypothetical protein